MRMSVCLSSRTALACMVPWEEMLLFLSASCVLHFCLLPELLQKRRKCV